MWPWRVNSDYGKEIVLLLSGTNTAYQAKSLLRMLIAKVTLGPTQAREVLMKVNWEHDNCDTLSKRSSKKNPPDVKTCFIHFLSVRAQPTCTLLLLFSENQTGLPVSWLDAGSGRDRHAGPGEPSSQ